MAKPLELDQTWLNRIVEQTTGLQYGSVVITIHDGRIVQIDRTERTRYDQPTNKNQSHETLKNQESNNGDALRIVQ